MDDLSQHILTQLEERKELSLGKDDVPHLRAHLEELERLGHIHVTRTALHRIVVATDQGLAELTRQKRAIQEQRDKETEQRERESRERRERELARARRG